MKKPSAHSRPSQNSRSDRALGLDADITRRDFLNSKLLASGRLLLTAASPAQLLSQQGAEDSAENDWTGYGGVGDYANSNGNTMRVMDAGTVFETENSRLSPLTSSTAERLSTVS